MSDIHEPGAYYWEAGAAECPHGPRPDPDTDGDAYDVWSDQHPPSDDVRICLDAPAGEACLACSSEDGEMVPWAACREREHARPKQPATTTEHTPGIADVGGLECLERECEEFFDDDGDDIPGKTACSHMREMEICLGCSPDPETSDFPPVVAWTDCTHRAAAQAA